MGFSLKQFSQQLYEKALEEEVLSRAATVAFYFSFSLFPLLLFLLNLFGMVLDNAADLRSELFLYLRQIMPPSAFELVQNTISEVIIGSSGSTLTLGLLIALWSASAGFDTLRGALNAVYDLKETRAWWRTTLLALVLTIGLVVLVSITLGSIFYGSAALERLPFSSPFLLKLMQWAVILFALLLAFTLLYNFLPDHAPHRWKWLTPGALVGIILWLLLSSGFRLYLQYFDNYAVTYGSLGAMMILMLWLYLTALVILLGAMMNSTISDYLDIKTETYRNQLAENKEAGAEKKSDAKKQKNPSKAK